MAHTSAELMQLLHIKAQPRLHVGIEGLFINLQCLYSPDLEMLL